MSKFNRGKAKLTESEVLEMRELSLEGVSTKKLAKRFGVVLSTVNSALTGRSWKHLTANIVPVRMGGEYNPNAKLTTGQVLQIKNMGYEKIPARDIAKHLKVSKETIWHILRGIRWNHLNTITSSVLNRSEHHAFK